MYLLVAKQLVIMSFLAIVSFIFAKKNHYGERESEFLSRLLLFVISPCMLFNAFNIPFSSQKLSILKYSNGIGFLSLALMILVAVAVIHSKTEDDKRRDCLDKMAFVFSNSGFIGIPLITGVYGEEGIFPLMGYLAIYNILMWTFGYYSVNKKLGFKQILLNPNIIAIVFGIIFFLLPVQLPHVLSQTIRYFGGMNTPVSMVVLGLLFADFKRPQNLGNALLWRVARTIVFRQIILPCLVLALFKLILLTLVSVMALQVETVQQVMMIIFIAASCPVGMNVANFAVIYNKDESYASLLVSISSVLCVVTVPLMVRLAEIVLF
ncbi:MAG: AEC family transporter [Treponema sp.]|nr:AEC family transporter [Treponema sp.]